MVRFNFKPAFSFAEMLISMLILSVFFLASTKIMTQKQKDEVLVKAHGFYECYYGADGGLKQAISKTGTLVTPTAAAGSCRFEVPRRNNSVFMVTVLFANNGGVVFKDYYINEETVQIIPPNGGNATIITSRGSEAIAPVENEDDLTYDLMRNNLVVTNPNSNAIRDNCGAQGRGGAVIINW